MRTISFDGSRITKLFLRVSVLAKKLDRFSKPRFLFMTEGFSGKLVAAVVVILASATILLGFIPLLNMVLMLPVVFFGIGSYTRDGLITAIGWLALGIGTGGLEFFI